MKTRVLVLAFSHLSRDPRIFRQLKFLSLDPKFEVTAAGFDAPLVAVHQFVSLPVFRSKSILEKVLFATQLQILPAQTVYWRNPVVQAAMRALKDQVYDLIIANDIETLPLALALAGPKTKVILDAHEYTPKQFDGEWTFRTFWQPYWEALCREFLPKVDGMMTVCNGIAKAYAHAYEVDPIVVTNAPFSAECQPRPTDPNRINLVHHGLAKRARALENMIELMRHLDGRFTLDLILVPDHKGYEAELRHLARDLPQVHFKPPVPMPEISAMLNANYDLGLCLFPSGSANYNFILPNKFFEFVQGNLGVITWSSPEIVAMLQDAPCGVIVPWDVSSAAAHLRALTGPQVDGLKQASHLAAQVWNAEQNRDKVMTLIDQVMGKGG